MEKTVRFLLIVCCFMWIANALLIIFTPAKLSDVNSVISCVIAAFFFYGLSRASFEMTKGSDKK